jgi:hypothetical protein
MQDYQDGEYIIYIYIKWVDVNVCARVKGGGGSRRMLMGGHSTAQAKKSSCCKIKASYLSNLGTGDFPNACRLEDRLEGLY